MGADLPKIHRTRKRLAAGLALLGAVAGFAATLAITTPPGPGLDPDAASYLGAAESLASGHGYRIPIASWASPDSTAPLAHFPPGFSTAIVIPMALGSSAIQGARLVNATAAAITLATAAYVVTVAAGLVAAAALALALLVTPAFVDVHLSVLSEPLFLACFALSIATMSAAARARTQGVDRVRAFLSGLVAAVAVLVRYAGIAATAAVVLWGLARRGSIRERLWRAALAALPTLVLLGPWVLHARRASGPQAIRHFALYGRLAPTITMGRDTMLAWLVPWSNDEPLPGRPWIALGVLLVLAVLALLGIRALTHRGRASSAADRDEWAHLVLASDALLAGCYVVVLIFSRLFADPSIPFDWRILAPLLLLLEIALAVTIAAWWRGPRLRVRVVIARAVVAVVLLAWAGAALSVDDDDVSWASEHGVDFASDQWRQSALIAWARSSGEHALLYANWPVAIYFHLHRHAWAVPEDTVSPATLHAFVDTLRARHALLLLFDTPSPGYAAADSLARLHGLRRVVRLADGSVFEVPSDSASPHPVIRFPSTHVAQTAMVGRTRSQ